MALRFLIADDNTAHQKLTANAILFLGGQSVCASNGAEALDLVKTEEFDVVMLDLWMPHLGGVATASRLLAEFEDAPSRPRIVAVTGDDTEDRIALCRAVGMDGFISKPCRLEKLRGTLQQVVLRGYCWDDGPSERLLDVEHFWKAVNESGLNPVYQFDSQGRNIRARLLKLSETNDDPQEAVNGHAEAVRAFAETYGFLRLKRNMESLLKEAQQGTARLSAQDIAAEIGCFDTALRGARASMEEARSMLMTA